MPKHQSHKNSDFLTRGELRDSLRSQKTLLAKQFLSVTDAKRLEERINEQTQNTSAVTLPTKESLVSGDVLLYSILTISVLTGAAFAYFSSAIKTINKQLKRRDPAEPVKFEKKSKNEEIDWFGYNKPPTQSFSHSQEEKIKEMQLEIEKVKKEFEALKSQKEETQSPSALPETTYDLKVNNNSIFYFEPTVIRKSTTGLSVFTAYDQVRMYEVFQLDVNPDGKTGTFFFNETLERGKNDVATELKKLFAFAEYDGSGSRTSFQTLKKGIARLISGDQWEVVEKAQLQIS